MRDSTDKAEAPEGRAPNAAVATVDVVIVGGGPVGAALALELDARDFSVLILEERERPSAESPFRPLALSYGSRLIAERLGIWSALAPATPIGRIHVSQRGRFGRTELEADKSGVPALGYVVDYAGLARVLNDSLARSRVRVLRGARVTTIAHGGRSARIEYVTASGVAQCIASVVAVADGGAGAVDVDVRVVDYGQSAITACLDTELPHGNIAYERFTPSGPIALLPYGGRYALVWTLRTEEAQRLESADSALFLQSLYAAFGERVGRFRNVEARAVHPLVLRMARTAAWGRAALVGNAAQTLHPVAGQGFNLGLRDAWELADEVKRLGPQSPQLLDRYRARRRIDRIGGITFTDSLIRLFSNDLAPVAWARGAGLTLLDCVPPLKEFVVRRMIFGARG